VEKENVYYSTVSTRTNQQHHDDVYEYEFYECATIPKEWRSLWTGTGPAGCLVTLPDGLVLAMGLGYYYGFHLAWSFQAFCACVLFAFDFSLGLLGYGRMSCEGQMEGVQC